MAEATISKTTKVNLSILGLLLIAAASGSYHMAGLSANIERMDASLGELKLALDRNTLQIVNGGKSVVILQTQIQDHERRIEKLDNRVQTLEKRK